MIELKIRDEKLRVKKVRDLILSAGNRMAGVWFVKRTDGKRRRMAFRLHVSKPTYATKPTGKRFLKNRAKDEDNHMITVFDTNKITYSKKTGKMNGRGAWRSIPLDSVTRIAVGGEIYRIRA